MKSLKNIVILTRLCFRELVRSKMLRGILIFMIILLFSSRFFTYFTFGEEFKIIVDIGLSAITFLGLLTAVWAGAWGLRSEMEQKTLWVTLSYPVSREQVLWGKFLGGTLIVLLNILIMSMAFAAVLTLKMKNAELAMNAADVLPLCGKAIFLILVESMMAISIVIGLSLYLMSIPVLTVFIAVYIVAHMAQVINDMALKMDMAGYAIVKVIYTLVPNFTYFNIKDSVVFGTDVSLAYVGWATLYGMLYILAVMGTAGMIFARKELK